MQEPCFIQPADPAVIFAEGGYETFMSLAPRTFEQAISAAGKLTDIAIEPMSFTASFDFDGQLTPFQRPPRPEIDAAAFEFNAPSNVGPAPDFVPQTPTLDRAPTFDTPDPILQYGARPDTPVVGMPTPPTDMRDLTIPDAPAYVLPPVPTMIDLNLPSPPVLQMPVFQGERPIFVEPPLNENWAWHPEQYVSAMLDKVRAKVSTMMDGGTGLGPIEDVLFERGRSRIEIETRRAIDTRTEEFASRGFSEPNGILATAVDEILQGGLNQKGETNREIVIESFRESLNNLRFSVQQGIALEQLTVNLHVQEQQLALQAAQFLRETAIAILNARVTVFNARLQAYQTDAQVLQARIQAELAKIEVFRAQIEGEKARGEINEQRVRLYAERVRAVQLMAEFYRSTVEAVKAQADVEKSKIERYKAEVDGYSARWRAFGDEVEGYKATVEAENTKAEVHRNLVQAFAAKVDAHRSGQQSKVDLERLRLDQHGQRLQAWRGGLDRMLALVQAETARIGGQAQRADALARIYTADASVESAASAASDRSFELGMEREKAEVETQLKAAEIRIQENIQLTQNIMDVRKTLTTVLAQLAASSLSAMNFSASVSSSRSQSVGCSTNFSWSGEIADYN